ncbi:MAG: AmmeMemoRadiSam system protein A [Acidiferrobacterales bacterium]
MSSSSVNEFAADEQDTLLALASTAIEQGLIGKKDIPRPEKYNAALAAQGASFVTLNCDGKLRGCIGTLEAHQSLVVDVAENAWSAAFHDRRFSPLTAVEFPRIKIHISVLTPASPVTFTSEQNLIEQLRPGIDGLILSLGQQRGTFLPSVWKALPDPDEFLQHLKKKAGLPADFWSDDIKIQRYRTISITR